jgi:Fic family protein
MLGMIVLVLGPHPLPAKPDRSGRSAPYERPNVQIVALLDELGGLPSPAHAEQTWHGIWIEEAHNSTAIEGNTVALEQVEQLLSEGRAVGDKHLSDYLEVQGYGAAANWVYGQAIEPGAWTEGDLISLFEVRHVHNLAMTPVWNVAPHPNATDRERPGAFREHDIAPFPEGMTPPSWPDVPASMRDWITDAQALRDADQASLIEQIADLHGRFEQVHPFLDGNGRAGRLVLNLLLVRLGYPPAIVYKADRPRYLTALQRCDVGDPAPLGKLLARAVLLNLHRFAIQHQPAQTT